MSGKPIVTEVNPQAGKEGSAGIMSDLQGTAGGSGESPALTDLGPLSARPRRRVSLQTMLVALVLALSAGAIYIMRRHGMDGGMKFKSMSLAADIEKVKGATPGSEQRILAELARSSQLPQGDQAPLQKNPFMLDEPSDATTSAPARDLNAERQALIRDKLANIKLNSVLDGSHPVARINDRTVSVGDIVDDIFLVAQIHDRSVDFIVDGRTYTLNMGEAAGAAPAARKGAPRSTGTPPPNPRK
jgi:hypothetical protein